MSSQGIQPGSIPFAATLARESPLPRVENGLSSGPLETTRPMPGPSFGERIEGALQTTAGLEAREKAAAEGLARGDHQDVHGTMIAMQEADIALRLVVNMRNRVIEAYREVMRMGA